MNQPTEPPFVGCEVGNLVTNTGRILPMGDDFTAASLQQDKGKTTDALRRDREAAASVPATKPTLQPMEMEGRQDQGLKPAPKGFDPYLQNGKGLNSDLDPVEYTRPGAKPEIECGPFNIPRCCCC